jgi:hypothetical protein
MSSLASTQDASASAPRPPASFSAAASPYTCCSPDRDVHAQWPMVRSANSGRADQPHGGSFLSHACKEMRLGDAAAAPSALRELQQHSESPVNSAGAASGCRLATVNRFVLNATEPQRTMQELVQALMEELSMGPCTDEVHR